jgi:hypothetical protein
VKANLAPSLPEAANVSAYERWSVGGLASSCRLKPASTGPGNGGASGSNYVT